MSLQFYIVETTTGDRWEIIGGRYVVVAESEADVAFVLKDRIGQDEEIESVKEVSLDSKNVAYGSTAIIE